MAKDLLTYDDLLQIVEIIKSAEAFSEFHLKVGEIELDLRKANAGGASSAGASAAVPTAATPTASVASSAPTSSGTLPSQRHADATPQRPHASTKGPKHVDVPAGSVVIKAPMVGTFYRRPEPGARPFVEVGDAVDRDTTVCIIEVMKLMNSITAGSSGRVTHILVDDAEPVQSGQQLIVIDPRG